MQTKKENNHARKNSQSCYPEHHVLMQRYAKENDFVTQNVRKAPIKNIPLL